MARFSVSRARGGEELNAQGSNAAVVAMVAIFMVTVMVIALALVIALASNATILLPPPDKPSGAVPR